jgi:N4-gp56 family major capsid protein
MAAFNGNNNVNVTRLSNSSRTRSNSAFITELWSDEISAAYKSNLVMPQLVVVMNHVGKKGDTVHVPVPTRGAPSAKTTELPVTLIAAQETKKQYIVDQHWEYSRLIEDIAAIQANDSYRSFYTDDAGYALAKKVDSLLHAEGAKFAGADASPLVAGSAYSKAVIGTPTASALVAWSAAANANAGNAATITDEGLRIMIRKLDDNDVPSVGRVLVVPPVEKQKLMGVTRFTEQAFVGEGGSANSIRNGLIGNLYGVEVYVSTNCPTVADGAAAVDQRAALLFQKDALVLIEQMRPRVQTQYKQEWLSDLFTADTIFGTGVLRPEAGIAIVVPA